MGIDLTLLRDLCDKTLEQTNFPDLGDRIVGKVRDSYVQGDQRTIIVSDRVSAFDVVVGTIPLKGQLLNQVAAFSEATNSHCTQVAHLPRRDSSPSGFVASASLRPVRNPSPPPGVPHTTATSAQSRAIPRDSQ